MQTMPVWDPTFHPPRYAPDLCDKCAAYTADPPPIPVRRQSMGRIHEVIVYADLHKVIWAHEGRLEDLPQRNRVLLATAAKEIYDRIN